MDSLRDSLRTGYTLEELVRVASVAQDRRPDWLAENLRAERGQHDEAELKTFIKDHIKAYALGIQCLLAVVLCLQVVCVVRLFWGQ